MKRTTYAEKHSEWVYDWPAILWNIEHGLFTGKEKREWLRASLSWVTCACGNQCADIPRFWSRGERHGRPLDDCFWSRGERHGRPLDDCLFSLGVSFYGFINRSLLAEPGQKRAISCAEARATLAAIEKRAAELLKEMGK